MVTALKAAIVARFGGQPIHKETVPVHEALSSEVEVWTGEVEVFRIKHRRTSQTCYAWLRFEDNIAKAVTVLANHFVNSPQKAVQAALFTDAEPPRGPAFRTSKKPPGTKESPPQGDGKADAVRTLNQIEESVHLKEKLLKELWKKVENLEAQIAANRGSVEVSKGLRTKLGK